VQVDTGTETVLGEVIDGVGIITLNRPDRRNALHHEMYVAVPRLIDQFVRDSEIGCIVITGAGKAFCSGGDVAAGAEASKKKGEAGTVEVETIRRSRTVEDMGTRLASDARMVELLHRSPKITLAALPGAAVGAGMSIALAADLRIASSSASLIPGWGRLGFSGDFGGSWFLTRLVGPARALEILIANTTIDSESALGLGLVNRVVPDEELYAAALEWASEIADGPRVGYRFMKENVQQAEYLALSEYLPLESERMARSGQTDDHRRAVKKWMEQAAAKREAKG
jgi:2-(1,2-epoxy-1,2-dihydrophenyl)acetyl-CoA isomerase